MSRLGMFFQPLKTALLLFFLLTLLTGIIYPLFITGFANVFFPYRANGSLMVEKGVVKGSELIGQPFSAPHYFWGRLSATVPFPYNAAHSSGSNLGPLNPLLIEHAQERIDKLNQFNKDNSMPCPVDLVTSSGSGLDPHISPYAAYYQAVRIAKVRGVDESIINQIIRENTTLRLLGIFGEPHVNVLKLNLLLDEQVPMKTVNSTE